MDESDRSPFPSLCLFCGSSKAPVPQNHSFLLFCQTRFIILLHSGALRTEMTSDTFAKPQGQDFLSCFTYFLFLSSLICPFIPPLFFCVLITILTWPWCENLLYTSSLSDSKKPLLLFSLQWMGSLETLCVLSREHSLLFLPAIQGKCSAYHIGHQSQSHTSSVISGKNYSSGS